MLGFNVKWGKKAKSYNFNHVKIHTKWQEKTWSGVGELRSHMLCGVAKKKSCEFPFCFGGFGGVPSILPDWQFRAPQTLEMQTNIDRKSSKKKASSLSQRTYKETSQRGVLLNLPSSALVYPVTDIDPALGRGSSSARSLSPLHPSPGTGRRWLQEPLGGQHHRSDGAEKEIP